MSSVIEVFGLPGAGVALLARLSDKLFISAVALLTLGSLVGCRSVLPVSPAPPGSTETLSSTPSNTVTIPAGAEPALSPSAPSDIPQLATPVSDLPAAGICGGSDGPVVTVTIYPDIPDPRCTIVRPDQYLRIVNRREESIQVSLAGMDASIDPGEDHTFTTPFGQLLAKGVHPIQVTPCCGAELWLQ